MEWFSSNRPNDSFPLESHARVPTQKIALATNYNCTTRQLPWQPNECADLLEEE